jgi:hypothetical protein
MLPELRPCDSVAPTVHTSRPRPDVSYSSLVFASIFADGETRTFNATGEKSTGLPEGVELEYAVSYRLEAGLE